MKCHLPRSPVFPADAAVFLPIVIDIVVESADLFDEVSTWIFLLSPASVVFFHFQPSFQYFSVCFSSHTLQVTLVKNPGPEPEPQAWKSFFCTPTLTRPLTHTSPPRHGQGYYIADMGMAGTDLNSQHAYPGPRSRDSGNSLPQGTREWGSVYPSIS